jgi:hypothetical protein
MYFSISWFDVKTALPLTTIKLNNIFISLLFYIYFGIAAFM